MVFGIKNSGFYVEKIGNMLNIQKNIKIENVRRVQMSI